MGRHPGVRWDGDAWVAEVGESWVDGRGRRRRREVRFGFRPGERELALAAMLAYRQERRRVELDPAACLTVRQVLQCYLQWSEANRAARTYQGDRFILVKFADAELPGVGGRLGDIEARSLDAGHLQAVMGRMSASGNSVYYVARMARVVKAAWGWAAKVDRNRVPPRLVPSNPLREVSNPKIPRSPERYGPRSESEAFFRFAFRRAKGREGDGPAGPRISRFEKMTVLMFRFIAVSGCRPDEAARATWPSINWDRATITIRGKTTGKTGRPRVIFLTPELLRILRAIRRLPGRHPEYVFTHRLGRYNESLGDVDPVAGVPWRGSQLQARVKEIRREAMAAGVPVLDEGPNRWTLYRLRHTRISNDLMAGASISEVAALHNTSEGVIRHTYAHLLHDHLADLNNRLAGRRRPSA